jgi:hypothetical protein
MSAYQNVFDLSMEDSETFWSEAATGIVWDKPWEKVLDDTNAPFYRWFTAMVSSQQLFMTAQRRVKNAFIPMPIYNKKRRSWLVHSKRAA